jgi:hypothetical protein
MKPIKQIVFLPVILMPVSVTALNASARQAAEPSASDYFNVRQVAPGI